MFRSFGGGDRLAMRAFLESARRAGLLSPTVRQEDLAVVVSQVHDRLDGALEGGARHVASELDCSRRSALVLLAVFARAKIDQLLRDLELLDVFERAQERLAEADDSAPKGGN